MRNRPTILISLLLLCGIAGLEPQDLQAQGVRYVYGDLGQLVRVIDGSTSQVATYHYHAAGNILFTGLDAWQHVLQDGRDALRLGLVPSLQPLVEQDDGEPNHRKKPEHGKRDQERVHLCTSLPSRI